ncbi:hypothetical protein L9F63_018556 [Diploptera punctata]|uniref:Uncharacterized protein n=1 Tax=Diploptera punctata TaxID=6984 RepID=A0AAD7ZWR0_DIPPU|nr:hypothetical protein L9F63_018556 [Diploptera punctata]
MNRPLSGGQFLGQLGQYIQQGLGQYQQAGAPPQYQQQLYQQRPPFGGAGLTETLTSIARYDDLKCVPRLLCEVAAGGRPGQTPGGKDFGGIPFLNKNGLMS